MEELLQRITHNPNVMGGKPCIRGMRVTVGTILGQLASGSSFDQLLADYPYLELEDIRAALAYGAWCSEERELSLKASKKRLENDVMNWIDSDRDTEGWT